MGELVAAMASSHAFAIEDPRGWDAKREVNRGHFRDRYGYLPADDPRVVDEDDDDVARRYGRIRDAFAAMRQRLEDDPPDALVLVADDQDECFTDGNFPQVAVYLGGDFTARDIPRGGPRHHRAAHPSLARAIYETLVDGGIDAMSLTTLPGNYLPSHAFGPVLQVVDPDARIPVVPVFVNAVHVPALAPDRCYRVGELVREAVGAQAGATRVVVYGSGGLSHFPSSFPPGFHGDTPFPWGTIDVEFDAWVLDRIAAGEGEALAGLSAADLLEHGEAELRNWIAVLGAVGTAKPSLLVYEPFFRAITGIGVAWWDLEASPAPRGRRP